MEVMKLVAEGMNIYVLAATVIAYVCIWRVVTHVWLRPRRLEQQLAAQGLKGNRYRLWYGDMKDLVRMTAVAQSKLIDLHDDIAPYVLPFPHHVLTKYGKRSFMWNGPTPRIMIMEPDMIKDVLLHKSEKFSKVLKNPLIKLLVTGLVRYEGAKWAKHRRLLNPSFSVAKLKEMVPTMHISCYELVETLENTMLSDSKSHEVDIWPIFSNFTADVISRTAFGSSYKEGQKIFQLQNEQVHIITHFNRSVYIPGSRFFPTKTNRRMKEIDREIVDLLKGIIQNKVEGMKAEGQNTNSNDLLGILLASNMKEVEENDGNKEMGITIEDVINECKLFYLAGQETTVNLLVWTMVMLSIHQNWQIEAREEVLEAFGKNIPNYDDVHQLKKMNMILHEVLRLYPPAPTILRTVPETTQVGDITLPGGVEVILPILLVHHDKEIWGEDAKEFKPERFAQGVANATKGQLMAFFPFTLGPRICIGMNFAMVEVKLALTMILQRFSFELSPYYEHGPVQLLNLRPKFGAKILFSKI